MLARASRYRRRVIAVGGYPAALWECRRLPMAPITVVRETSVICGAIIGVTVIREGLGPQRIAAACLMSVVVVILTLLEA